MNELYGIGIIPIILGVVEVFKRAGVNQKYSPLVSIMLGLAFGWLMFLGEPAKAVVYGLMFGLSAVGLYSGSKNTNELIKGE